MRHFVAYELHRLKGPSQIPKLLQGALPAGRYSVELLDQHMRSLWRGEYSIEASSTTPPLAEDLVSEILEDRIRHREGPINAGDLPRLRSIVEDNRKVLARLDRSYALDLVSHFWQQIEKERLSQGPSELSTRADVHDESGDSPSAVGKVDRPTSPVDYFDLLPDASKGFVGIDPMDLLPGSRWRRSSWGEL